MNKKVPINILKHITVWIIYLFLPIILISRPDSTITEKNQFVFLNYLLSSIYSIIFFYINYYWAIPKLFYNNKKWIYFFIMALVIIFCFSVYRILPEFINFELRRNASLLFVGAFSKLIFIFIVSWVIFLYNRDKEQAIARKQAEIAYLKAQINPHFLFNVLNSLYALAIKKSDKTSEAISQLSDIMRYNVNESQKSIVPLNKELDYIEDYIDIQKLRLTPKTKVSYHVEGNAENKNIEPLLLITFIENAFKFGVSTEKKSEIVITIKIDNQHLKLIVLNDKVRSPGILEGAGLKNTIKRLDYTYENNYKLDIVDNENYYKIELLIKLK